MNADFSSELNRVQSGDTQAAERILTEFTPLIKKYRYIGSHADEDLLSELYLSAYLCILRFKIDEEDMKLFLKTVEESDFFK